MKIETDRFPVGKFMTTVGIFGILCAPAGAAVTLTGTVKQKDGHPAMGGLVTLSSGDGSFVESVYAGRDGGYSLTTEQKGKATLRARSPYFADAKVDIDLAQGKSSNFVLAPLTDPQVISDSLSASAHFARIRFEQPVDKQWFQVECLTCHQIGNAFTRTPRTPQRWHEILTQMLGFYNVTDKAWIDRYANLLAQTFNSGARVTERQHHVVNPEALHARIFEWKLPGGVIAHDVEYHAADGKFYTVDQGTDQILITDPIAAITETYTIPKDGIPQGGKFYTMLGNSTPLTLTVSRGPHSLQEGPDGHFYTTDTISGQIGEFDPKARTYVGHDIGGNSLYPHTLRFDRKGRVWFTIAFSNQVGMLDTQTGKIRVIELPPDTDRAQMPAKTPYGIDVNPVDGSIWYSSLMANRIGRIDPDNFSIKSFTPPTVGPRRMRFAADGTLWIPDFGRGQLVKLDTQRMEYKSYPIPSLARGEVEAPYAVGVHPVTHEVWITANMSDRMFRFLPKEERFIAYPLPTRGIYLRDIIFTPQGMVCSGSSPMPAPLVVEGGMQEILCLDPIGNLPLPRPAI